MKLSLIAAMDNNHLIGLNNTLPWHLPADLKHFKSVTMGKPILMGRNTYESIGKPLPGRENIVLSRQTDYIVEGCTMVRSVEQALAHADQQGIDELMVIGGAKLYSAMLSMADRLYLTYVDTEIDIADTPQEQLAYFPKIDCSEWTETHWERHDADEKNRYSYSFVTLERACAKN